MEQTTLNIKMTPEGANAVLNALGNLPTSSGLWSLFADIRDQANAQLKAADAAKSPKAEG